MTSFSVYILAKLKNVLANLPFRIFHFYNVKLNFFLLQVKCSMLETFIRASYTFTMLAHKGKFTLMEFLLCKI